MKFLDKIRRHLSNPKGTFYLLIVLLNKRVPWLFSDKICVKAQYYVSLKENLDLKSPKTFNEKLQWLKLFYRRPELTLYVDKIKVKDIIVKSGVHLSIIPTIGVYDKFDDIDFDSLPSQFVLKTNHDSASVIICKDKNSINKKELRRTLNKSLRTNFYLKSREWPYKYVPRRIFAEEYIQTNDGEDLKDYKFFCFSGKVHFFKVDFDRFTNHHANYYDRKGELMPFYETLCPQDNTKNIVFPENLNEMIHISEELSQTFPFARVDLYNVGGKIFFGEMTFFPAAGTGIIVPKEWNYIIGEMIHLPEEKYY